MNTPPEKSFSISKKVSPAKKEKGILQRIFLEGVPPERSGGGRRRVPRHHAIRAYARVQSNHALRTCEVNRPAVRGNGFGFCLGGIGISAVVYRILLFVFRDPMTREFQSLFQRASSSL